MINHDRIIYASKSNSHWISTTIGNPIYDSVGNKLYNTIYICSHCGKLSGNKVMICPNCNSIMS
jgi:rubrerythrin